jgi:hypothetical protein
MELLDTIMIPLFVVRKIASDDRERPLSPLAI